MFRIFPGDFNELALGNIRNIPYTGELVTVKLKLKHRVAVIFISIYYFIDVTLETFHIPSLRCA